MSPAKKDNDSIQCSIRMPKQLKKEVEQQAELDSRSFAVECGFIIADWMKQRMARKDEK